MSEHVERFEEAFDEAFDEVGHAGASFAYWDGERLHNNYHLPGSPPRAMTVPDEGDLARLAEEVRQARAAADVVVVSFHWDDFLRAHT
jgi:hypothetical protein